MRGTDRAQLIITNDCLFGLEELYLESKLRFPLISTKLFLTVIPSKLGPHSGWKASVSR